MKRILDVAYFATAFAGAIIIALNIGQALLGYLIFLASSALGGYIAWSSRSPKSIVWVNVLFGCVNILGIMRAM